MKINSLSQESRARRLNSIVDPNAIVSLKTYNLVLTGAVCYGLLVNVLLCRQSIVEFIFTKMNPIVFLVGYLVCMFGGIMLSRKSTSAAVSFLGYNMIVVPAGLSVALAVLMGGYDPSAVSHAVITTAGVTVIMVAAGLLFPQVFAKIGSVLFFGLIGVLIGYVVSIFIPGVNLPVTILSAGIFSLYIGYDIYRSQQFPHTIDNAIDCAVDIYLDIINLFLDLLRIFGDSKD